MPVGTCRNIVLTHFHFGWNLFVLSWLLSSSIFCHNCCMLLHWVLFLFHLSSYDNLLCFAYSTDMNCPRQQITNVSVDTNTFAVKNKAVRPLLMSNKLAFQDNKRSLINSASVLFGRQFKIVEMVFKSPSLFFLHEILPSGTFFDWFTLNSRV